MQRSLENLINKFAAGHLDIAALAQMNRGKSSLIHVLRTFYRTTGTVMIAFCTYCWTEINVSEQRCPACGHDLSNDTRSYEEKLLAALQHPLPAARIRICWLIGENHVQAASDQLMKMAECDSDLFVRRAAVEALGHLHCVNARRLLQQFVQKGDRLLAPTAERALNMMNRSTKADDPR